jgi:hypothetical protein
MNVNDHALYHNRVFLVTDVHNLILDLKDVLTGEEIIFHNYPWEVRDGAPKKIEYKEIKLPTIQLIKYQQEECLTREVRCGNLKQTHVEDQRLSCYANYPKDYGQMIERSLLNDVIQQAISEVI